jgi:hypothetical protein
MGPPLPGAAEPADPEGPIDPDGAWVAPPEQAAMAPTKSSPVRAIDRRAGENTVILPPMKLALWCVRP